MTNFTNVTSDFNGNNSTNIIENNSTIPCDNCSDSYYMVERNYFINIYSGTLLTHTLFL